MTKQQEQALVEVEERRENLNQESGQSSARVQGLEDKKKKLSGHLAKYLVEQAAGGDVKKHLDNVRAEILEVEAELHEIQLLEGGLRAARQEAAIEEQSLKVGISEARVRELAPQVDVLAARFLELREDMRQVCEEYNRLAKEANGNAIAAHEKRQLLGLPSPDLPSWTALNWEKDNQVSITPEMLSGKRAWA